MRPVYFIFRILFPYVYSVFFRRRKVLNFQWKLYNQAIYVTNHPSAFLDPLLVASRQFSILYFMTRGDIFKPWLKPITWSTHMVPIYRTAEDGADSAAKNKTVFKGVRQILKRKKSLIMFGEGYTDDVFVRRLKPLKKGPARIGFGTLDSADWELDIKIIPVGLNYADPDVFRSDVLISYGEGIPLKNYKNLYDDNPNKAITQLTRDIDAAMKQNLTHLSKKELNPFLENILKITWKGMNAECHNKLDTVEDRYKYTKNAANIINENYTEENELWTSLRSRLKEYFSSLEKTKIAPEQVHRNSENKSPMNPLRYLYVLFLAPLALIGVIHCLLPYFFIKRFVEKMFKRRVFWSGVKILLTAITALILNLPVVWLFHDFIYESYWLGVFYLLTVPALTWIIAYNWSKKLKSILKWHKADKMSLDKLTVENKALKIDLNKMGF